MKRCTVVVVFAVCLQAVAAIVCPQGYCASVNCADLGECPENSLRVPNSSYCGCCDTCVTTLSKSISAALSFLCVYVRIFR